MSIPSISEVAPISLFSTVLAPATPVATHLTTSTITASPPTNSTISTSTATPAATASFSSGAGTGISAGNGSSSPSVVAQIAADVTYSTTVQGRSYVGSVAPTDGQYEASVSELPGANASGASVDLAETNLNNLIDFLV